MTVPRVLLLRCKTIEQISYIQQLCLVYYLNLQKNILSKRFCLIRELTLLKLPLRNIGWLGLCHQRKLLKTYLFRYFFLYPIVSDYQKFKFGGPIFDLPILSKSDISILFSVSDKYRKCPALQFEGPQKGQLKTKSKFL
jgi:hypothetical protein